MISWMGCTQGCLRIRLQKPKQGWTKVADDNGQGSVMLHQARHFICSGKLLRLLLVQAQMEHVHVYAL